MARRSDEDIIVQFGEVELEYDTKKMRHYWSQLLGNIEFDSLGISYVNKLCLSLTQFNNLCFKNSSFPKVISCVNTVEGFLGLLLLITIRFKEETIVDIRLLFNHWLDFLNQNVDYFDKLADTDGVVILGTACEYFLKHLEPILNET